MFDYNFDNLNRDAGSGSLTETEVKQDEGGKREHFDKGRRTSFNPHESNDPQHWEWLNKVDSGMRDDGWRDIGNKHHQQVTIETFCGQLGLTSHQQQRVKYLFNEINGDTYSGNYKVETVVMSLISLVQNEDIHTDDGTDVRDQQKWKVMLIELEIDDCDVRRLRGKFRDLLE